MVAVIIFLLLVAVVLFIGRPLLLRAQGGQAAVPDGRAIAAISDRLELEAARDAKLREIRDAELDHQTGKLSEEDYEAVDSTLRNQAITILNELDELEDESGRAAAGLDDPGERLR